MSLSSSYNPKEYEQQIQMLWQQNGVGQPEQQLSRGQCDGQTTHSILMPPPNLTGPMHAGHSYQHYLMDTLSRYNRQNGKLNLWYPGVDHAGIQLEGVIGKLIQKGEFDYIITAKIPDLKSITKDSKNLVIVFEYQGQQVLREDLHNWLKKHYPDLWLQLAWSKVNLWRDNQKQQAQVLGDTPDYTRQLFTLDSKAVDMVNQAYIKYWQDGLIYKGAYLVNWSVGLQTALSDVAGEIEYETRIDPFITFYYDLEEIDFVDDSVPYDQAQRLARTIQDCLHNLKVSTVRPETVFGDVAIAIHPQVLQKLFIETTNSQEIIQLIQSGKLNIYYKVGVLDKTKVKLIISTEVDPEFGSGTLKVTPASDITDYNLWKKYLQNDFPTFPHAIDRSGKLTEVCGKYAGLNLLSARVLIIKDLIENGQIPYKPSPELEVGESETRTFEVLPDSEFAKLDYKQQLDHLNQLYPEYEIDWGYSHNVSICERTKTVIEPLISEEFFLSFEQKAASTGKNLQTHGLEGVEQVQFYTPDFKERAVNFLENIHDWCISRDVIWGHKMPVWYNLDLNPARLFFNYNQMESSVEINGETLKVSDLFRVQVDKPTEIGNWVQEEKILDTWFSSSLWPLSTLDFYQTERISYEMGDTDTAPHADKDIRTATHLVIYSPQRQAYLVSDRSRNEGWKVDYHFIGGGVETGETVLQALQREAKEEAGLDLQLKNIKYLGRTLNHWTSNHGNPNRILDSQVFYLEIDDLQDSFVDADDANITSKWVQAEEAINGLLPAFAQIIDDLEKDRAQSLRNVPDYFRFYPTQELTTAKEIFYVWVVRMIVLGKYFTGHIPFESVVITPTVLDEHGKKMSKSLGNGLDPVEAITKYSSDSLRLAMLAGMYPNRNMKLGGSIADRAMEKYRNFGNKVWNVARFIELVEQQHTGQISATKIQLSNPSRWILGKFIELEKSFTKEMKSYELGHVVDELYNFLWDYFANWYVEYLKTDPSQITFVRQLFTQFIHLAHPFLPYETEVLWKEFVGSKDLLAFARYDLEWSAGFPLQNNVKNPFENIIDLLQNIRSTRGLFAIDPAIQMEAVTKSKDVYDYKEFFNLMGKVRLSLSNDFGNGGFYIEIDNQAIYLRINELIKDPELEKVRTSKRISDINLQMENIKKVLDNPKFRENALDEVIKQKESDLMERKKELQNLNSKLIFLNENLK